MNKLQVRLDIAGMLLPVFALILATGLGAYSRFANNGQIDFTHWVWAIRIMWGGMLLSLVTATYSLAKIPEALSLPHVNRRLTRIVYGYAIWGTLLTITFAVLPAAGVIPDFISSRPWPEPLATLAFGSVFVALPSCVLLFAYSGLISGFVGLRQHCGPKPS